jgi:hypothetical protein
VKSATAGQLQPGEVREAVICHFDQGKAPAIIRLHRVIDDLISVA